MNTKEMTTEQLIERRAAIAVECEADGADLEALTEEVRAINAELETRKAAEAARQELRNAVANGSGTTTKKMKEETKMPTIEEVRNSEEYIHAFAKYIRTGNDKECRALLSANAGSDQMAENSGTVPVPVFVEGRIRTAWEKTGLMQLVRKTYLRGNVQVGFELSATDAVVHEEGNPAIEEEQLALGIVTLTAQSIKKMVRVSDEALDYGDREFLEYIYDEITYRIAKKAEELLISAIANAPTTATHTAVSVTNIADNGTDLLSIVARAYAQLSDDAANPVIVMNKATYADFVAARNAAGYGVDPFMGLPVYFNSTLDTPGSGNNDVPWLVVGDFGRGAQANFPNGDEITLKFDDVTEMAADIVRILGREFVGLGLVADKAFCTAWNDIDDGNGGD